MYKIHTNCLTTSSNKNIPNLRKSNMNCRLFFLLAATHCDPNTDHDLN